MLNKGSNAGEWSLLCILVHERIYFTETTDVKSYEASEVHHCETPMLAIEILKFVIGGFYKYD